MSGGASSGSGRALRLDPFSLPARFWASDTNADEKVRQVDLYRERVVVRRSVRGMPMALNMPVSSYRGVSIRMVAPDGDAQTPAVAIVLEHADPSLALPLYISTQGDDLSAEWRAWGNVLGLPLLVTRDDGSVDEPFRRIGGVRVGDVQLRRRRRNAIRRRRPTMPLRRAFCEVTETTPVHAGEREIIARN